MGRLGTDNGTQADQPQSVQEEAVRGPTAGGCHCQLSFARKSPVAPDGLEPTNLSDPLRCCRVGIPKRVVAPIALTTRVSLWSLLDPGLRSAQRYSM